MSVWEWQCRELRRLADKLGNEEEVSAPFVRVLVIPIMREAADTIASLSRRLQEQAKHGNEDERESCESNYSKLFGTPERAAKTLEDACFYCDGKLACDDCVLGKMRGFRDTEDEVEEWLRSDA